VAFTGLLGVNRQFGRTDSDASIGDSAFSAILGWQQSEHHWNLTVTGFAPTGDYDPDKIAFTSLHRPAVDVKGAYTFLSLTTGTEVSAALGVTFNTINTLTNYLSGNELHFEWALNQHFPNGFSLGVGGFLYQQLNGDSGSGNRIGPFIGRVASVGPLAGYTFKALDREISISARWFHEFAVERRVRGDSIFATLTLPLSPASALPKPATTK
jgi:hypothetical protein